MSETNEAEAVADGQTEEMVSVTINNEAVEIPKALESAAQKLVEMESNIQRGATQKFEEASRMAKALDVDVEWFNSHPQEQWEYYSPTVKGGNGQLVSDAELAQINPNTEVEPKVETTPKPQAFEQDKNLDRLARLEREIDEEKADKVVSTIDALVGSQVYGNANRSEVLSRVGLFFNNEHRHPTKHEVEAIVKKSHMDQTEWLKKRGYTKAPSASTVDRPPMPSMRAGAPAKAEVAKLPPLSDFEAWGKRVSEG